MLKKKISGLAIPPASFTKVISAIDYASRAKSVVKKPSERLVGDVCLEADILSQWDIKDQSGDPACVAFAAAACAELHRARVNGSLALEDLSPAYLYWRMRQDFPITVDPPAGYNAGASLIRQARDALSAYGACSESLVPYDAMQPKLAGGKLSIGWADPFSGVKIPPPGSNADKDAAKRKISAAKMEYGHLKDGPLAGAAPKSSAVPLLSTRFHAALRAGKPVVIGVPMWDPDNASDYSNWETPEAKRDGVVFAPCDLESGISGPGKIIGGHVVCLVGFRNGSETGSRGWFIFRNSHGADFARYSGPDSRFGVPAPGYGALSADHIDLYCWEYMYPK